MAGFRYSMIGLALGAIAGLGLDRAFGARYRGRGVILTFHHVRPQQASLLDENAGLAITPAFLETAIETLRATGYDIIPLDEVAARLADPALARPFAVLTFDDGYRDNAQFALPVLKRLGAPFTLFVCPGFADREANLWWLDLEEAAARVHTIRLALPGTGVPGEEFIAPAATEAEKRASLRALYWRLRDLDEASMQAAASAFCRQAGVDQRARVERLCLDWDGLRAIAAEPLATIGAHTLTHPRLAKLDAKTAALEIDGSRSRIREELGVEPRHFAYPVGDPTSAGERDFALVAELGFASGVTTRPGVLKPEHLARMAALPRISVNGLFQRADYLRALISGVPFALRS
jgi:peptidoglycan/xylan/chitin deacetylase (PgdA/CDA1 family)